jgi:phage replication-related protein YjqB (UPF0714/DUF867 family)
LPDDKYKSFADLEKSESLGRDFRVRVREVAGTAVIISLHGGRIEPGTSEIADAIAADIFHSTHLKKSGFEAIMTCTSPAPGSTRLGIALLQSSTGAICVHGEGSQNRVVFLGGRDEERLRRLRASLEQRGFCVKRHQNPNLQGEDPANICNRTKSGVGVQLELSKGLRRSFFQSLTNNGRQHKTHRFEEFVEAVRRVIL